MVPDTGQDGIESVVEAAIESMTARKRAVGIKKTGRKRAAQRSRGTMMRRRKDLQVTGVMKETTVKEPGLELNPPVSHLCWKKTRTTNQLTWI